MVYCFDIELIDKAKACQASGPSELLDINLEGFQFALIRNRAQQKE